MSLMLPEPGEVMRRAACGDVCAAPATRPASRSSDNKELLRQQLLSANKDKSEAKVKQNRNRQKNRWKLKFHHQALPQEYLDHYEQSLQKTATKKKCQEKQKDQTNDAVANETFKLWAQRLAGAPSDTVTSSQTPPPNTASKVKDEKKKKSPTITPSKIVTYDDLPYMGEMTLNNSKPRRGRKPKKADICHLIYENYGTVVPGQPPPQHKTNQTMCSTFRNNDVPTNNSKTDLQNKIISSLLERKLSQENKRRLESLSPPTFCPDEPVADATSPAASPHSDDEPLNLCIRDLHDLRIQIQKKFGNIYTAPADVKIEVDDTDKDSVKSEQPNAISVIQRAARARSASPAPRPASRAPAPALVCWPHAGVYMHPLALQTQLLYYQRLAAAGQLAAHQENDKDAAGINPSPVESPLDDNKNKLVLKQLSELLDPKVIKKTEETKSPEPKKRASPNPTQGPVKRKRSAIFIPPMPVKNNSSTPTTEVSICKFKFTGGSKPSLQEKKMLSVDSGGNFRYYNGTSTKGSKGYDYIQKNNEERITTLETPPAPAAEAQDSLVLKDSELSKKKRKSRRTLQREKLEQTFKEKGFLIQTQQLQSAEGATYCKFRQLRKFTRYLFRSWKDYLPGELHDRPSQEGGEQTVTNENASDWG